MRAVGDQCRTLAAAAGSRADLCDDPVAGEAEGAGERQCLEVLYLARLDQAVDRFIAGDAALTRMASTTANPAQRSARALRSANAMPRGIAVAASPALWMRSARL